MPAVTEYGWSGVALDAPPDDETTCDSCGESVATDTMTTTADQDVVCHECLDAWWESCTYCGDYFDTDEVVSPADGTYRTRFHRACEDCRQRRGWEQCVRCSDWISQGTHYDYCDDCRDGCECDDCMPYDNDDDDDDASTYSPWIRGYSYKPDPIFLGGVGDGRYHLGLELEVEVPDVIGAAEIAATGFGDVAYLKSDCSINRGFEIVTHPMTHSWVAESFPWHTLDRLRDAGADGYSTGIHVHVSRSGFSSPAHIYRWMKLIYRNEVHVQRIARRESRQWAAFHRSERDNVKGYAKGERYGERYSAINVNNYATFEVRVFRSSVNREEVRAALDMVAASVEYTRHLTVADIRDGGWTWDRFITWANERPEYSALVAQNGR